MLYRQQGRPGFTLVEMLVVITIIMTRPTCMEKNI